MTRTLLLLFTLLLAVLPNAARSDESCPDPLPAPYVFLLMDTSASMNYSPPCSSTQIGNGECSYLCPTGDCFVPLQGDDPASKFYQLKEGLHTVLAGQSGAHFGFASFNQDDLGVRAKHWFYQAQGNGPLLTGGVTRYPATGAQEVFGLAWGCDTGNSDNEIGCLATKPADLTDTWELTRVQRLPKGGISHTQSVTVYIRQSPHTYRVLYTPTGAGTPGSASLQTTVRIDRCNNAGCTAVTFVGQQTVTWSKVTEFLSWDNADSSNTSRTNPQLNYFGMSAAADAEAANTCSGWDPNSDSASDEFDGYSLRWPTVTDLRGTLLYRGDVIPLDWLQDNNSDIQARLAPNLLGLPGTPDVRIAPYLEDARSGAELFLRLKDEAERPLIAVGSTPLGSSMASFSTWYGSWSAIAEVDDPDWSCRKKVLVLLTDGEDTCEGDPCAEAEELSTLYGVEVQAVGFGVDSSSAQLQCIGTHGSASFPETRQELIDSLNAVIDTAKVP